MTDMSVGVWLALGFFLGAISAISVMRVLAATDRGETPP